MSTDVDTRSSAIELTGLILSLLGGAVVGLLIPLKAEAGIATVVTFAIMGAIIWTRRRESARATVGACCATLVVGWPVAFVFLDWLHRYY